MSESLEEVSVSGWGVRDPKAKSYQWGTGTIATWQPGDEIYATIDAGELAAFFSKAKTIPDWLRLYRVSNISKIQLDDKDWNPPTNVILDDAGMVIVIALVPVGTMRGRYWPFNFDKNGYPKAGRPKFGRGVWVYYQLKDGGKWVTQVVTYLVRNAYYIMSGGEKAGNTVEIDKGVTNKDALIQASNASPSKWTHGTESLHKDADYEALRLELWLRADGANQNRKWDRGLLQTNMPGHWLSTWQNSKKDIPMLADTAIPDDPAETLEGEGEDQTAGDDDNEDDIETGPGPQRPRTRGAAAKAASSQASSTKATPPKPLSTNQPAKRSAATKPAAANSRSSSATRFTAINSPVKSSPFSIHRSSPSQKSPPSSFAGRGASIDYLRGQLPPAPASHRQPRKELLELDREGDKSHPLQPVAAGVKRATTVEGQPLGKRQRREKEPDNGQDYIEEAAGDLKDYFISYNTNYPRSTDEPSDFDKPKRKVVTDTVLGAWKPTEDGPSAVEDQQQGFGSTLAQQRDLIRSSRELLARQQAEIANTRRTLYTQYYTAVDLIQSQPAQQHLRSARESVIRLNAAGEFQIARTIALNIATRLERDPPLMHTMPVDRDLHDLITEIGMEIAQMEDQVPIERDVEEGGTEEAPPQLQEPPKDESSDEIEGL